MLRHSAFFVLPFVLGCGAPEGPVGGAGGCVGADLCGQPRAAGERCEDVTDPCTGARTACPCSSGLTCTEGVCVAKRYDTVQPPHDDEVDPYRDEVRPCDPANPCPRPGPEGAACGVQSAGCPGVHVMCGCEAGLACVGGTCRRAGGQGVGGPCRADARHCCMPDGRLVVPGGCQPIYPRDVEPATRRNPDGTCQPIECRLRCLPETARIDTPDGPVVVTALRTGDLVFTRDETGARIVAPVLRVRAVPVTRPHAVTELALADGRVVRASAAHPTAGGGPDLGELRVGDWVDGAEIVAARTVPYDGSHTWDLRPAGPTGEYWADGVLLGSTL